MGRDKHTQGGGTSWSSATLVDKTTNLEENQKTLESFIDEVTKEIKDISPEARSKYNIPQNAIAQLKSLERDNYPEAQGRLTSTTRYMEKLKIPREEEMAFRINYVLKAL